MINLQSLNIHSFSYPILKTDCLIETSKYNDLKQNWPKFTDFQTTSAGQISRNNLELKRGNRNYHTIYPLFRNLYDSFDSKDFRAFLKSQLDLDNASKYNGFVGDFDTSELIMHIAESRDGYENPWHVDTRGRIIHFLIYFGDETITEGGELGIANHKKLNNYSEYKQYPNIDDLEGMRYIKPKDNVGIFILSQNNSYHKGCFTKGLRRFIYAGYTNKNGDAWITKNWSNKRSFNEEVKYQKLKI